MLGRPSNFLGSAASKRTLVADSSNSSAIATEKPRLIVLIEPPATGVPRRHGDRGHHHGSAIPAAFLPTGTHAKTFGDSG